MDSFKGLNGIMILNEDYVSIIRKTSFETVFHKAGEIKIYYSDIKK